MAIEVKPMEFRPVVLTISSQKDMDQFRAMVTFAYDKSADKSQMDEYCADLLDKLALASPA